MIKNNIKSNLRSFETKQIVKNENEKYKNDVLDI